MILCLRPGCTVALLILNLLCCVPCPCVVGRLVAVLYRISQGTRRSGAAAARSRGKHQLSEQRNACVVAMRRVASTWCASVGLFVVLIFGIISLIFFPCVLFGFCVFLNDSLVNTAFNYFWYFLYFCIMLSLRWLSQYYAVEYDLSCRSFLSFFFIYFFLDNSFLTFLMYPKEKKKRKTNTKKQESEAKWSFRCYMYLSTCRHDFVFASLLHSIPSYSAPTLLCALPLRCRMVGRRAISPLTSGMSKWCGCCSIAGQASTCRAR